MRAPTFLEDRTSDSESSGGKIAPKGINGNMRNEVELRNTRPY